jgi:hypothetical protein
MYNDVLGLSCLLCGSFAITTEEANLWMSNGGTRSLIHHDADTLINCVIDGRKEWAFVNWERKFDLDMNQRPGEVVTSGSDFSE